MVKPAISPLCKPLPIDGNYSLTQLPETLVGEPLKAQACNAPRGDIVCWGIPFSIEKVHVIANKPIAFTLPNTRASWLCFMHTAKNIQPPEFTKIDESMSSGTYTDNSLSDWRELGLTGTGHLGRIAATYTLLYADGGEEKFEIRYRHQINTGNPIWGENCFQAVPQTAPSLYNKEASSSWGLKQTVYTAGFDRAPTAETFMNWICAWENPYPDRVITGMQLEPGFGTVLLSAVSACDTTETPLRWETRKKLLLTLPKNRAIKNEGPPSAYRHISETRRNLVDIDMGAVLSVVPRYAYNNKCWQKMTANTYGEHKDNEYIVEYAAHPDAQIRIDDGKAIKLATLNQRKTPPIKIIPPANQRVVLKVIDKKHRTPVAVRLHIHGDADEYLAPVDRHRMPNSDWFEDYAPEFAGPNLHNSTYIDGQANLQLPLGNIYLEISKGFECKPIYKVLDITPATTEITIEIDRVLNWREKGWVTADTHVHFLSPKTANLEGAAEDISVVNLLASQWGELMTNVGDFDGKTTFKNRESHQNYLVRVGTENRQHVLGHISLLGYNGPIISPMCAGGPDEAAIGDPVDTLITEWAKQCQHQDGLVVLPHFPSPRAESAATIISGCVDAVEMDAFSTGIKPYALVNWYRYLNCGYQIPLTGGTDKMSAAQELGRIRGYSKLEEGEEFTYDSWKQSVRRGNTFVTFGPLIEFSVNGNEAGSRIRLGKNGGTITANWLVKTLKHTITGVELIINGDVIDGTRIEDNSGEGYFEFKVEFSGWVCLLIRGTRTDDGREKILAHSSSVMLEVEGKPHFSAPDAISMLDQIEGSMAYLDHIGTQAETKRYKAMRLVLEQAYKTLHDRLHQFGYEHNHSIRHNHH